MALGAMQDFPLRIMRLIRRKKSSAKSCALTDNVETRLRKKA